MRPDPTFLNIGNSLPPSEGREGRFIRSFTRYVRGAKPGARTRAKRLRCVSYIVNAVTMLVWVRYVPSAVSRSNEKIWMPRWVVSLRRSVQSGALLSKGNSALWDRRARREAA